MKDLRTIAMEETTLSDIMVGRSKVDTEQIKKIYPNGISINAIDIMKDDEGKVFYVYTIAEQDDIFLFSGAVLNRIFDAWLKSCDGNIADVNKKLNTYPIKVVLGEAINSKRQRYTTVTVL